MNVGCIALRMFSSHELMFHSLSLCDHYRQPEDDQTKRTGIMTVGFFFYGEKIMYIFRANLSFN